MSPTSSSLLPPLAALAALALSAAASCVPNKRDDADKKPTTSAATTSAGPRALAQATLHAHKDTAPSCPDPGSVLDLGTQLVDQGGKAGERAVKITCKVARQGAGYLVDAKIALSDGSSLVVASNVDAEGRSAAADVVVARPGGATWTTDVCKLEPATDDGPGIEPGRYAATMRCRAATSPGGPTCDVTGHIRVEGCAQ